MQSNTRRTWGSILYLLGVLLCLGLAIVTIWGDYEANAFYDQGAGYARFSGLNCPVLMSRSETNTVSATFENSDNQAIQPYYEVDIAATASTRHMEDQLTVPAKSSRSVSWNVNANDINLGSFILVKMDVLPTAEFSTREATCGIVVMNFGEVPGRLVFGAWLGAALLAMVVGLVLRESGGELLSSKAMNLRNGLRAAGITTLLALLTGLMGLWLIGVLFVAITFLLLVILLNFTGA
jgi:hypothetical protein